MKYISYNRTFDIRKMLQKAILMTVPPHLVPCMENKDENKIVSPHTSNLR